MKTLSRGSRESHKKATSNSIGRVFFQTHIICGGRMLDKIKAAGNKAEELMAAIFHTQFIISLRDANISRKAESQKPLAVGLGKSRNSKR